jgi:glucoamylase
MSFRSFTKKSFFSITVVAAISFAHSENAPNPPGAASVWASGAKEFIGTAAYGPSRVYFSGTQGIVTEVFYPAPDQVQNVDMQFIVTDSARTWGTEEKSQKSHKTVLVNKHTMEWQVTTIADNNKWKIEKKIFTDPSRDALIQQVTFSSLISSVKANAFNLYILNNPAINNTGAGGEFKSGQDNSRNVQSNNKTILTASEPNSTSSALAVSLPWKVINGKEMVSHGFVGVNDGFTDLFAGSNDKTMNWTFDAAIGGNVAQMGWIDISSVDSSSVTFSVVLSYAKNETEAVKIASDISNSDIKVIESEYVKGWSDYANRLNNQGGSADDQYYLAAMSLKCIQDKSNGAMIAGLGTPWGETCTDRNQGGYHLVWARDLFKFASALLTAGDTVSANDAVSYLFNIQMQTKAGDKPYSVPGRFPQNTYVNGTIYWNGTQMDETAMPVILAWKLHRTDLWPKIKMAAEFLSHNGPATNQERWEEMAGYSPSTIAAEIAGLVCAADMANEMKDSGAAKFYLKKADEWRNNVANWTFTTTGYHGNKQYYIRINANQDPNDDVQLSFGNNTGSHGEKYIIDGGFLELVRMGVMSPKDWTILETISEYDSILKQNIPDKGPAWFRYNYDGYGEYNDGTNFDNGGRGRLWPIFTAERGIYEITNSGNGSSGQIYLNALKKFSSPAGFIPEQVWNNSVSITGWQTHLPPGYKAGTATKSMQPLSWAMGEYINLVAAMKQNKSDAPSIVSQRYSTLQPQVTVTFEVEATTVWGENIRLTGSDPLLSNWDPDAAIMMSPEKYPVWSVKVSLPASKKFDYKFVKCKGKEVTWQTDPNNSLATPASGSTVKRTVFK